MKLSRDAILQEALILLDEEGLDALSTRRLAERLDIKSATLYWHFKNKQDLINAMAEEVLKKYHTHTIPVKNERWQSWLKENLQSFRKALLSHRDGAKLHAGAKFHEMQFDVTEQQIDLFYQAGFTPVKALNILIMSSRFVVGWVFEEQENLTVSSQEIAQINNSSIQQYPLFARAWHDLQRYGNDELFIKAIDSIIVGCSLLR